MAVMQVIAEKVVFLGWKARSERPIDARAAGR
jgi:hypothetical protein